MKKILYVLHSGITGGTFLTNKDLMKHVKNDYEVFLLSAENNFLKLFLYYNNNLKLIKEYPLKEIWDVKNVHSSWLTYVYFDILMNNKIDIVHIRHLINHSFDLPQVAYKLNIPVVLSFHDFYFICPSYPLINENNEYCEGICSNSKINCYCPLYTLEDINFKEIIPFWRDNVLKLFGYVDCFITTSDIVKNLFLSIYPMLKNKKFEVIEHGRDFPQLKEIYHDIPSKDKPIKILCPTNYLNKMKGSELIKNIKKEDKNNLLEFHFLGNIRDNLEEYGICHGTFERDEFYKKVKEIKPSFIGIFSTWPETFCHTITEAWSSGIPVIGTNIGVIEDRIIKNNGGWIVDKNDSKKAYEKILNISYNKDAYLSILDNIKNIELKSTKEMSKKYLDIYKNLDNF